MRNVTIFAKKFVFQTIMRVPLSIFVAYHSGYGEGGLVYNKIYKDLCRDSRSFTSDGLEIPVRFCAGDDSGSGSFFDKIDFGATDSVYILLLIDSKMNISEKWKSSVKKIVQGHENLTVQPVLLSDYAYGFCSFLNLQAFILKTYSVLDNWDEFKTLLYDSLIRSLKGDMASKNSIFISHSKRDYDGRGEIYAKKLRDYLRHDTVLDSFFDCSDILPGTRWDRQIEGGEKNSILLVLFTNTYSSREWCRREVITAKNNRIPAVALFMLDGSIDRVFPYIGNIPGMTVRLQDTDWRPVINMLLRTALKQYYSEKFLEGIADGGSGVEVLPYPPETYSFAILKNATDRILYPEPPLGPEEINVLRSIDPDRLFLTPSQYVSSGIDLKKHQVAISISDSDNLDILGFDRSVLDDVLISLSRHLLLANAHLAYGGDLRCNGYTELFKELSYQYGLEENSDDQEFYFTDYMPWPVYRSLTEQNRESFIHSRVRIVEVIPPDDFNDTTLSACHYSIEYRYRLGCALTEMRIRMEKESSARVLLGGKCCGFSGFMPGVLEEFSIARRYNHPIYLIGAFGGVSGILVDIIEGKCTADCLFREAHRSSDYKQLLEFYSSKGKTLDYDQFSGLSARSLNNGLSDEDNNTLFHSTNVTEIVSLILKGLKTKMAANSRGDGRSVTPPLH